MNKYECIVAVAAIAGLTASIVYAAKNNQLDCLLGAARGSFDQEQIEE